MQKLFRNKVSVKIASGYVIIFLCILIAGSFVILRLFDHANALRTLSDQSSVDARFVQVVVEKMKDTSTHALLFLAGRDPNVLWKYNQAYGELDELLSQAEEEATYSYSQYEFESIHGKVKEYNQSFSQAVIVAENISDFENQIIGDQNTLLESKMQNLEQNIFIQRDLFRYRLVNQASLSILYFQLNILNFLNTYNQEFTVLADQNLSLAKERLGLIKESSGEEELLTLIDETLLALDAYHLSFEILKNDIVQLDTLKLTSLEVIEPEIIERAYGIDQKIRTDNQTQVMLLEEQLRNTFAFFGIFFMILVGISVWAVRWTSAQITYPLQKILTSADEIARHDLKLLTSDLQLLSQGNLAVGAGFISQTVELEYPDEVGRVAEALNAIISQLRISENVFYSMAEYLHSMSDIASRITHDQYDVEVKVRSDQDALGNALAKMIARLRDANFKVQKQLIQISTLREIDTLISTRIDLKPTLQFIIQQACRLLGFSNGSVILFGEESEDVKEAIFNNAENDENHEWMVWFGNYLRQEGHPLYINDISQLIEGPAITRLKDLGMSAWYGDLIFIKGQFRGIMQVFHNEALPGDAERIEYFSTLLGQVGIAIEHAELLQDLEEKVVLRTKELRRRAVETQTAAEISHAASSTLQLQELMDQSVDLIQERFDVYYVGLFLVGERGNNAWLSAATGEVGRKMLDEQYSLPLIETSMVGWTILRGKLRAALNVFQDPLHYHNPLLPETRSEISLPLITRGLVIGALTIQSKQPEAFTQIEVAVLQTIANQLANAIANARLYQESQREKQFFESIVRTSTVAVVILDLDESILVWNPAAEKLFGWSAAEALGKKLNDLVKLMEQPEDEKSLRNLVDEGQSIQRITRRLRKNGVQVDVELSATFVRVEDGQAGILVMYHDITELQQARKVAETATQAKSDYLASISHEIRTPMNAIVGMSDLLLASSLTSTQREFVETIRTSSDTMLEMLNDLLDFAKMEARRLELDIQPFDLRECVESAIDLVSIRATIKNLDLAYLINPQVPLHLLGDMTRLGQILINLLTNAVKFTEEGEVVVRIKASQISDSSQYEYHFSILDTGIGIIPEQKEKLFQAFSQADISTSRKYGGTGLGLAISKQLVELMGGSIWVESNGIPGEGSTFSFTIVADVLTGTQEKHDETETQALRGARALVGMPSTTSTDFTIQHLLRWGVQVDHRKDCLEFQAALKADNEFTYILCDSQMLALPDDDQNHIPCQGGVTSFEDILNFLQPVSYEKFIVITPKGQSGFYIDKGILCLEKPIKPLVLLNILRKDPQITFKKKPHDPARITRLAEQWPLNILVVEDDPVNQKVIVLLLSQLGYQAEIAGNGLVAIEKLQSQTCDVVFLDVHMPEMDGIETCRRILADPNIVKPFLVAMTADALLNSREDYTQLGIDAFLLKPFKLEAIYSILNRYVRNSLSLKGSHQTDGEPQWLEEEFDHRYESYAAIDPTVLNNYLPQTTLKDHTKVLELINLFIEETSSRISELREYQYRGDTELARNAVHTIKGSSLTFGAVKLSEVAGQIEQEIQSGNLEGVKGLIDQMEWEYSRVVNELRIIGGSR